MTAQLAPPTVFGSRDNLGFPLVGGKLFTYQAGTTTPQATYTDSTQGTPNTNPVVLNFRGEAFVWLDPTLIYKFVLQDAFGNLIWTEDNIPGGFGASGFSISLIPGTTNTYTLGSPTKSWAQLYLGPNAAPAFDPVSGNIGYYARTAAEIAAGVTPVNYAYLPFPMDARRYGGAPGASTTTNNTAIAAMATLAKQAGSGAVYFCTGTWDFGGTSGTDVMWFQTGNLHIYGDGPGKTILRPANWINGLLVADANYPSAAAVLSNVLIENLTIDGTNQSAGANDTYGNGVNLNAVDQFLVRNVTTINPKQQPIVSTYYQISGAVQKGGKITQCTVNGVPSGVIGIGIEGNSSNCIVSDNIVTGNLGIGIFLSTGGNGTQYTTGNNLATGNSIAGPVTANVYGIVAFDGSYRNNITGNTISGADISIRIASFTGSFHESDALIESNYCVDWITAAISAFPMDGTDSTETTITGNKCKSAFASGSSNAIIAGKNCVVQANHISSGNTGVGCTGGGQRVIGNVIEGTVISIDTLTAASTGAFAAANQVNAAPALNPDTVYQRFGGYGGTIASAATISIPVNGDYFQVTGTTNISSIAGANNQNSGSRITLEFAGVLTVVNGSNIRLNANFTTAAGSTLTLACSANQWNEVARTA